MPQIVSNRTGREKIIKAEGENTEIVIVVKKERDHITVTTELKLNPVHNFKNDYKINLQAYESSGFAKKPWSLGTVGDTGDFQFTLSDIDLDRLLFRLKVVDKNNIIKGYVGEISPNLTGAGNRDQSKEGEFSNTILPIRETDKIKLPFAVEMSPDVKPVLLVKSKLNLKEQFKHDIKTKIFIYTSVIRQIITTYLSDKSYANCSKKESFINKVLSNAGVDTELEEIPEYFDQNRNVNSEAIDWIEQITADCIDHPVQFKGSKVNYLKVFEKKCKEQSVEEDYEN